MTKAELRAMAAAVTEGARITRVKPGETAMGLTVQQWYARVRQPKGDVLPQVFESR